MTRDPDSGRGRLPHQDWSGRGEITRPGVHVERKEPSPVDELRERVNAVGGVVADHAATIAERYSMPSTEAWRRLVARQDAIDARVAVCEDERKARARWAKIWTWAKGLGGGGVFAVLVWAVVQIGNAGAARERAAADAAALREVINDVRVLRESTAADHALIQVLLSTLRSHTP